MRLEVIESPGLGAPTRRSLRQLWSDAFGDRFSAHDADHAYGGVHVIAYDGTTPIGHASVVPRRISFDATWLDVGYVEAVATGPGYQRQGVGTAVMSLLHDQIRDRWGVAMLSTGQATGFYERLGWERWRGVSFTLTQSGAVPDSEHGGLMILRLDPSAVLDLTADVTCEDRPGDAW